MRKKNIFNRLSPLFVIFTVVFLIFSLTVVASAEEGVEIAEESVESGDLTNEMPSGETNGGEITPNIFEEIYIQLESNADKIFSALAFIATLIVGIFYKSGLLPLLKDALSRLKSTIDKAKEAEEAHSNQTNSKIDAISETVAQMEKQINSIELGSRDIEKLCRERDAMRTILTSQVDMLYAIFICSSLPEYQKEEIGLKIQQMREELSIYEQAE